ncbi:MAG TPA: hypothetical protein VIG67_07225 [Yaniella sp.]
MQRLTKTPGRILALALAAGLALAGCSSEAYENQPGGVSLVMQHTSS